MTMLYPNQCYNEVLYRKYTVLLLEGKCDIAGINSLLSSVNC